MKTGKRANPLKLTFRKSVTQSEHSPPEPPPPLAAAQPAIAPLKLKFKLSSENSLSITSPEQTQTEATSVLQEDQQSCSKPKLTLSFKSLALKMSQVSDSKAKDKSEKKKLKKEKSHKKEKHKEKKPKKDKNQDKMEVDVPQSATMHHPHVTSNHTHNTHHSGYLQSRLGSTQPAAIPPRSVQAKPARAKHKVGNKEGTTSGHVVKINSANFSGEVPSAAETSTPPTKTYKQETAEAAVLSPTANCLPKLTLSKKGKHFAVSEKKVVPLKLKIPTTSAVDHEKSPPLAGYHTALKSPSDRSALSPLKSPAEKAELFSDLTLSSSDEDDSKPKLTKTEPVRPPIKLSIKNPTKNAQPSTEQQSPADVEADCGKHFDPKHSFAIAGKVNVGGKKKKPPRKTGQPADVSRETSLKPKPDDATVKITAEDPYSFEGFDNRSDILKPTKTPPKSRKSSDKAPQKTKMTGKVKELRKKVEKFLPNSYKKTPNSVIKSPDTSQAPQPVKVADPTKHYTQTTGGVNTHPTLIDTLQLPSVKKVVESGESSVSGSSSPERNFLQTMQLQRVNSNPTKPAKDMLSNPSSITSVRGQNCVSAKPPLSLTEQQKQSPAVSHRQTANHNMSLSLSSSWPSAPKSSKAKMDSLYEQQSLVSTVNSAGDLPTPVLPKSLPTPVLPAAQPIFPSAQPVFPTAQPVFPEPFQTSKVPEPHCKPPTVANLEEKHRKQLQSKQAKDKKPDKPRLNLAHGSSKVLDHNDQAIPSNVNCVTKNTTAFPKLLDETPSEQIQAPKEPPILSPPTQPVTVSGLLESPPGASGMTACPVVSNTSESADLPIHAGASKQPDYSASGVSQINKINEDNSYKHRKSTDAELPRPKSPELVWHDAFSNQVQPPPTVGLPPPVVPRNNTPPTPVLPSPPPMNADSALQIGSYIPPTPPLLPPTPTFVDPSQVHSTGGIEPSKQVEPVKSPPTTPAISTPVIQQGLFRKKKKKHKDKDKKRPHGCRNVPGRPNRPPGSTQSVVPSAQHAVASPASDKSPLTPTTVGPVDVREPIKLTLKKQKSTEVPEQSFSPKIEDKAELFQSNMLPQVTNTSEINNLAPPSEHERKPVKCMSVSSHKIRLSVDLTEETEIDEVKDSQHNPSSSSMKPEENTGNLVLIDTDSPQKTPESTTSQSESALPRPKSLVDRLSMLSQVLGVAPSDRQLEELPVDVSLAKDRFGRPIKKGKVKTVAKKSKLSNQPDRRRRSEKRSATKILKARPERPRRIPNRFLDGDAQQPSASPLTLESVSVSEQKKESGLVDTSKLEDGKRKLRHRYVPLSEGTSEKSRSAASTPTPSLTNSRVSLEQDKMFELNSEHISVLVKHVSDKNIRKIPIKQATVVQPTLSNKFSKPLDRHLTVSEEKPTSGPGTATDNKISERFEDSTRVTENSINESKGTENRRRSKRHDAVATLPAEAKHSSTSVISKEQDNKNQADGSEPASNIAFRALRGNRKAVVEVGETAAITDDDNTKKIAPIHQEHSTDAAILLDKDNAGEKEREHRQARQVHDLKSHFKVSSLQKRSKKLLMRSKRIHHDKHTKSEIVTHPSSPRTPRPSRNLVVRSAHLPSNNDGRVTLTLRRSVLTRPDLTNDDTDARSDSLSGSPKTQKPRIKVKESKIIEREARFEATCSYEADSYARKMSLKSAVTLLPSTGFPLTIPPTYREFPDTPVGPKPQSKEVPVEVKTSAPSAKPTGISPQLGKPAQTVITNELDLPRKKTRGPYMRRNIPQSEIVMPSGPVNVPKNPKPSEANLAPLPTVSSCPVTRTTEVVASNVIQIRPEALLNQGVQPVVIMTTPTNIAPKPLSANIAPRPSASTSSMPVAISANPITGVIASATAPQAVTAATAVIANNQVMIIIPAQNMRDQPINRVPVSQQSSQPLIPQPPFSQVIRGTIAQTPLPTFVTPPVPPEPPRREPDPEPEDKTINHGFQPPPDQRPKPFNRFAYSGSKVDVKAFLNSLNKSSVSSISTIPKSAKQSSDETEEKVKSCMVKISPLRLHQKEDEESNHEVEQPILTRTAKLRSTRSGRNIKGIIEDHDLMLKRFLAMPEVTDMPSKRMRYASSLFSEQRSDNYCAHANNDWQVSFDDALMAGAMMSDSEASIADPLKVKCDLGDSSNVTEDSQDETDGFSSLRKHILANCDCLDCEINESVKCKGDTIFKQGLNDPVSIEKALHPEGILGWGDVYASWRAEEARNSYLLRSRAISSALEKAHQQDPELRPVESPITDLELSISPATEDQLLNSSDDGIIDNVFELRTPSECSEMDFTRGINVTAGEEPDLAEITQLTPLIAPTDKSEEMQVEIECHEGVDKTINRISVTLPPVLDGRDSSLQDTSKYIRQSEQEKELLRRSPRKQTSRHNLFVPDSDSKDQLLSAVKAISDVRVHLPDVGKILAKLQRRKSVPVSLIEKELSSSDMSGSLDGLGNEKNTENGSTQQGFPTDEAEIKEWISPDGNAGFSENHGQIAGIYSASTIECAKNENVGGDNTHIAGEYSILEDQPSIVENVELAKPKSAQSPDLDKSDIGSMEIATTDEREPLLHTVPSSRSDLLNDEHRHQGMIAIQGPVMQSTEEPSCKLDALEICEAFVDIDSHLSVIEPLEVARADSANESSASNPDVEPLLLTHTETLKEVVPLNSAELCEVVVGTATKSKMVGNQSDNVEVLSLDEETFKVAKTAELSATSFGIVTVTPSISTVIGNQVATFPQIASDELREQVSSVVSQLVDGVISGLDTPSTDMTTSEKDTHQALPVSEMSLELESAVTAMNVACDKASGSDVSLHVDEARVSLPDVSRCDTSSYSIEVSQAEHSENDELVIIGNAATLVMNQDIGTATRGEKKLFRTGVQEDAVSIGSAEAITPIPTQKAVESGVILEEPGDVEHGETNRVSSILEDDVLLVCDEDSFVEPVKSYQAEQLSDVSALRKEKAEQQNTVQHSSVESDLVTFHHCKNLMSVEKLTILAKNAVWKNRGTALEDPEVLVLLGPPPPLIHRHHSSPDDGNDGPVDLSLKKQKRHIEEPPSDQPVDLSMKRQRTLDDGFIDAATPVKLNEHFSIVDSQQYPSSSHNQIHSFQPTNGEYQLRSEAQVSFIILRSVLHQAGHNAIP